MFASEFMRRPLTTLRSKMIGFKLGSKGLIIGPRAYIRGLSFMRIGSNFHAADGLWMEAISVFRDQVFAPQIVIGDNVTISHWTHIAATHYVEIGAGSLIGSKVIITDHNHGQYGGPHSSPLLMPAVRPLDTEHFVIIGRNVWLADGVVVTPGSRIGDGSIIGANSVVTSLIPPNTIAVGIPARAIKQYDFDLQKWISVQPS